MEYKGYTGIPFIDEESESLYGHVIGLRDVITFQGETFTELTQSFRDSVDEYLDFCESLGRTPEKPFSGRLLLRIPPELHRKLSVASEASKMSLNALILEKLQSPGHELMREQPAKGLEQPEANPPRRCK
jgi:predicted HicB family RNase H-like nuclease